MLRGKVGLKLACKASIALLFLAAVCAGPARADGINTIDFGINSPAAGAISYNGLGGALIGSGISISNIAGLGTVSNSGASLGCSGCALNFQTGNFLGATSNAWVFGAGGLISITGGISALGIAPGSLLLAGSFVLGPGGSTPEARIVGDDLDSQTFHVAMGAFIDSINPALASYFGLLPEGGRGIFNPSFIVPYVDGVDGFDANGNPITRPVNPGEGFQSSAVLSGDVTTQHKAPEPASLLLLGTGLIGLASLLRRQTRSQ